jgi:hypothetical protein
MTNDDLPKHARLWTSSDPERLFLIPEHAILPGGDLQVRTALGQTRRINAAAASRYEVSRDQADAWLQAQASEVLGRARDAILSAVTAASQERVQGPLPPGTGEPATQREHAENWLEIAANLAERYGEPSDDRSRAAARGVRQLAGQLLDVVTAAANPAPERRRTARDAAAALDRELAGTGIDAPGATAALADRLSGLVDAFVESGNAEATVARIQGLAKRLEDAAATIASKKR